MDPHNEKDVLLDELLHRLEALHSKWRQEVLQVTFPNKAANPYDEETKEQALLELGKIEQFCRCIKELNGLIRWTKKEMQ